MFSLKIAAMKVFVCNAVLLITVSVLLGRTSGDCENLGSVCRSGHFLRDPDNCNWFCQCAHQRWYQKRCPMGLLFDEQLSVCNWPDKSPMCDPPQGLCDRNPCLNGGTCTNKRQGYTCQCPPGFGGVNCNLEQDPCMPNPCQNGGQCRPSSPTTVTCDCPPNFTGGFCQDTTCQRYTCPNNVTSFNYPNWQDQTCASYFECQLGRLRRRQCRSNNLFSFMLLRCVEPAELEFPCSLNFVDSAAQ